MCGSFTAVADLDAVADPDQVVAEYTPVPEITGNELLIDPGVYEAATKLADGIAEFGKVASGENILLVLRAGDAYLATADQAMNVAIAAYKAGYAAALEAGHDFD
jgi:hypothetical protein